MQIITSRSALSALTEQLRSAGKKIGFVPTMGALHAGHGSLIKRAKEENDYVVVSVFVNPTQFNNPEDLRLYPRTPEQDEAILRDAGCDVMFFPSVAEMYPEGMEGSVFKLDLGTLGTVMEGKHRPGHFDGVVRVVRKLFEITGPCSAYFGEKDFQQLAVIRFLVNAEELPVNIIGCPTMRERDGLAMSSRNVRLDKDHRTSATAISRALFGLNSNWNAWTPDEGRKFLHDEISRESLLQVEYAEICDADTLQPLQQHQKANAVACVAVFAGPVRLIDNIRLS